MLQCLLTWWGISVTEVGRVSICRPRHAPQTYLPPTQNKAKFGNYHASKLQLSNQHNCNAYLTTMASQVEVGSQRKINGQVLCTATSSHCYTDNSTRVSTCQPSLIIVAVLAQSPCCPWFRLAIWCLAHPWQRLYRAIAVCATWLFHKCVHFYRSHQPTTFRAKRSSDNSCCSNVLISAEPIQTDLQ